MHNPLLTLTTDFGPGSPYVAAMKGVILEINPRGVGLASLHADMPRLAIGQEQIDRLGEVLYN